MLRSLAAILRSRLLFKHYVGNRRTIGTGTMAVTRSASGATAKKAESATVTAPAKKPAKRKATGDNAPESINSKKKVRSKGIPEGGEAMNGATSATIIPPALDEEGEPQLVPAVLTFSFEEAKQHLINVDCRFEDVFKRLPCKPFEHLERLDPFRTLAHSIMGQQISWKAARSITHRFVRLFDPSLPEEPGDHSQPTSFFPSARQVANANIAALRTAGLSGRKAEYVLDLAQRFADGRLSTEKLLQANDEYLYDMLIAVRGIGRWTVDMFALFSLRRPDILPVGDLGVQRGIIRWFLSLHAPSIHPITISPEKLPKNSSEDDAPESNDQEQAGTDADTLPALGEPSANVEPRALTPDLSSIPPVPSGPPMTPVKKRIGKSKASSDNGDDGNVLPTPFTPSIDRTLTMNANADPSAEHPPPLPEGLTAAILKSRLDGKKKIKGALLTPKEMEELTESWRPYRSLGVYYMWALAAPPK